MRLADFGQRLGQILGCRPAGRFQRLPGRHVEVGRQHHDGIAAGDGHHRDAAHYGRLDRGMEAERHQFVEPADRAVGALLRRASEEPGPELHDWPVAVLQGEGLLGPGRLGQALDRAGSGLRRLPRVGGERPGDRDRDD